VDHIDVILRKLQVILESAKDIDLLAVDLVVGLDKIHGNLEDRPF
jgi:hypothetical protein